MLVCAFSKASNAHETAGAARTRSSPRPLLRVACALLLRGGEPNGKPRAKCRREKAEVCVTHPSRRAPAAQALPAERALQDEVSLRRASGHALMVRRRASAVSNHGDRTIRP